MATAVTLGADSNDLDEGVGCANGEARPLVEVCLCVDTEGTGDRMNDGHLSDGICNDDRDYGAEKIREDDAWTGQSNREGAAEKEPDSDRAADRHHRELAQRE